MLERITDPQNVMIYIISLILIVLFINIWSHRHSHKRSGVSHDKLDRNYDKIEEVYTTINLTAKRVEALHQHITKP